MWNCYKTHGYEHAEEQGIKNYPTSLSSNTHLIYNTKATDHPFTFLPRQTSKRSCRRRRHGPAGKIRSLARVVVSPSVVLRKHPAVSQLAGENLIRRVLIVFLSVVSSATSCHRAVGLALIRTSVEETPYVSQLDCSVLKRGCAVFSKPCRLFFLCLYLPVLQSSRNTGRYKCLKKAPGSYEHVTTSFTLKWMYTSLILLSLCTYTQVVKMI